MSGLDFQSRFEERIAPSSLSSYMEKMEEERESARPGGTSLRKKRSGAKVKKSVTFQDETNKRALNRQSRQSRSSHSKFRVPKWAREVPESERAKQQERTCYSPSDYCLDLAREHNTKRCHSAASRCYLAALDFSPGDQRIHSAFKTSLAFVRNNRPYFVPDARKSTQSRSVK